MSTSTENIFGGLVMRSLEIYDNLSEETLAFSCEVYKREKLFAVVSNDGKGGCHRVRPGKGYKYSDVSFLYENEFEFTEWLIEVDALKNDGKAFILKKDGEFFNQDFPGPLDRIKKAPKYKQWLQAELEKFEKGGYTVLNSNL